MPTRNLEKYERKSDEHGKKHVKFIVKYLDTLKEQGLLEQAVLGKLPDEVVKAAKKYAAHESGVKPWELTEDFNLISTAEQDQESNRIAKDYIEREKLEWLKERLIKRELPPTVLKGNKHLVKSGTFRGRCILILGLDTEIFGSKWDDMFGHPLAEKHLFRMQQDGYPWGGRVYVCKLLDEKRDVLIHESEIGLHII